uniref:outer membrane protein n=1 Tax=Roseococcus sp. YIM B11640 TaxID=3133973 RepID=UPI003C7CAC85
MRFAKPVLAASLLALPAVAQAQPITGLYIGGGVGANLRDYTSETTNFTGPAAANGFIRTNFHTGYAVVGSVGWGFGNGFRVEVEGNYRYNDINSMNSVVGSSTSVSGAVHQYGGMVNAFYDFNMLTPYMRLGAVSFTPYVGLGVGYLVNDWRKVGARASNSLRLRIDDSDGQFAYQGIAGISMGLDSMVPGLAATLEYRYLSSIEPSLSAQLVANNGAVVGNGTYKPGVYNHSILLGLRYAFNAPRPAPVVAAPAPAPAPARTFL